MSFLDQSGLSRVWAKVKALIGDGSVTIRQDGAAVGSFSANQSGDSVIDITTPTFTVDTTDMCLYRE